MKLESTAIYDRVYKGLAYIRPDKTFAPAIDKKQAEASAVVHTLTENRVFHATCNCQSVTMFVTILLVPNINRRYWEVVTMVRGRIVEEDMLLCALGLDDDLADRASRALAGAVVQSKLYKLFDEYVEEVDTIRGLLHSKSRGMLLGDENACYEFYDEAKSDYDNRCNDLLGSLGGRLLQLNVDRCHDDLIELSRKKYELTTALYDAMKAKGVAP